ncbi:gamma-glutamylcyclotransferase family protein [Actinospongicola halichondriae]|uniref:gamma-glutamylcyclotransferase family protein n=1 Tax=Actinospongicola halichondriae TaxID=3236844 RepID=UPI003D495BFA
MGTTHRLFVYGTLRHPPLLAGLVGRPVPATPATLRGHRAAVLRGAAYPGLVVDAASTTVGSLIEVDDDGLDVLDRFEGPEYTRTSVTVQIADGTVDADAYLLTGPTRSLVEPGTWSLDDFVAGDAADWVHGAVPGTHHPRRDPDGTA